MADLKQDYRRLLSQRPELLDWTEKYGHDGVWLMDLRQQKSFWMNERGLACLGHKQLKYSEWEQVVAVKGWERVLDAIDALSERPNDEAHDLQLLTFDLKMLEARCWVRLVKEADGGVWGMGAFTLKSNHAAQRISPKATEFNRFHQAAHVAQMGHWELDHLKNRVVWSDEIYKLFDLEVGSQQPTYEYLLTKIHPEDLAAFKAAVRASFLQQKDLIHTHRIVSNAGTTKLVESRAHTSYDLNGHPLRTIGTIQDVTSIKKYEAAIEKSNRIFLHSLDLLCIAGFDGYFKVLNPAWSKLLGWTTDELLAKPWLEFVHPHDHNATINIKSAIVNGEESFRFENRYLKKDGSFVWLSWNSFPYPDEGIMIGVARDVTLQKEAELKMKEQEARLQFALEISQIGAWELEVETGLAHRNLLHDQIFGYDKKLPEWSFELFLTHVHPDDQKQVAASFQEAVINHSNWQFECRIITAQSEERWIQAAGRHMLLPEGKLARIAGVVKDITDQKKAEQDLRVTHEKLTKLAAQVPGVVYQFQLFEDGRTCFPYSSPGIRQIYEVSPEEVMQDATIVFERLHPDDRERVTAEIFESAAKLSIFNCEYRVVLPGKSPEWRISNARPERMPDGSTLWYGIITDITQQKEVEQQLRLSEAQLTHSRDLMRYIINHNTSAVAVHDQNLNYVFVSQKYIDDFKLEGRDIIGRHHYELFPDLPQKWKDIHQRALQGESLSSDEDFYIKANGEMEWTRWDCRPWYLLDGSIGGIIVYTEIITSRKKVEEELRKTSSYLANLLDYANAPIITWDSNFAITRFNHAFERLTGYSSKEVIGQNLAFLFPPHDANNSLEKVKAASAGDYWDSVEIQVKRKDGEIRTALWNSANIYDGAGKRLVETIAQGQDITERKQVESELHKLSQAVEQSPASVVITDLNGKIEYVNSKFITLTGYSAEEAMGNNQNLLKSGAQPPAFYEKFWETIHSGKIWKGEFLNRKKNNELYWESATISPILNDQGRISHFLAVKEDITERKAAEKQLNDAFAEMEVLRNALDHVPIYVYMKDLESRYTYANQLALRFFKLSVDQLGARSDADLFHPETAQRLREIDLRVFAGEQTSEQIHDIDPNGVERYFLEIKSPIYDKSDKSKVIGLLGFSTDITESVHHLKRIELLLQVEEEQNKRLRNFTHIVSHNLRSHTANMMGIFSLLELDNPAFLEDQFIKMIKTSAENLNGTIAHLNEVLDINLTTKEKLSTVDLSKTIVGAISSVSLLALNAGLKIQNQVESPVLIEAVPAYLDSIVLNMLTNAIKFKSPDRSAYIDISVELLPQDVVLRFKDNGLGIDLERHGAKLFGMYKTFHKHQDSKGLGLFITKNQIEAMGGSISVESVVDQGTTFIIKFPRETSPMA